MPFKPLNANPVSDDPDLPMFARMLLSYVAWLAMAFGWLPFFLSIVITLATPFLWAVSSGISGGLVSHC